jgi:hypothetical protein
MPKPLLKLCGFILCLCAVISLLLNYQIANKSKPQRQLSLLDDNIVSQFDWIAVLEQLPQYRQQVVINAAPDNKLKRQSQLSDGKIIGIVLDPPKFILLFVDNSDSFAPLQLTLGEGWLDNWVIKKINADSVVWFDSQSQKSYIQRLFNDAELPAK